VHVTTRPARPDDLELAFQIKKAALGPYVAQLWGWNDDEQRAAHTRRFAAHDVRIIQRGGEDVGLMATTKADDAIHLHQLLLLPAHQSKGIGATCLGPVIAEAHDANLPIRLQVLKTNPRAAAFYLRHGFAPTGETESHVLMEKRP
jgi:GNAT superfamily N-acetyltransferase